MQVLQVLPMTTVPSVNLEVDSDSILAKLADFMADFFTTTPGVGAESGTKTTILQ